MAKQDIDLLKMIDMLRKEGAGGKKLMAMAGAPEGGEGLPMSEEEYQQLEFDERSAKRAERLGDKAKAELLRKMMKKDKAKYRKRED